MGKVPEDSFISTDAENGYGIALEKYQNDYSLVLAKKNANTGDVWQEWSYPQSYEDGTRVPNDKAYPTRLKLGIKEQSLQRLFEFSSMIWGSDKGKFAEYLRKLATHVEKDEDYESSGTFNESSYKPNDNDDSNIPF